VSVTGVRIEGGDERRRGGVVILDDRYCAGERAPIACENALGQFDATTLFWVQRPRGCRHDTFKVHGKFAARLRASHGYVRE